MESSEMLAVSTAAVMLPSPALDLKQLSEEASKKIRKPYTISKSRESWTEQEHDKFLEALQLFDRDWKKIEAFIGSKTVIQIRSHAQKYFLKVQKNGSGEHVPPPRPKRKSSQPYPQKASKCALLSQQILTHGRTPSNQTESFQSHSLQHGNVFGAPVFGSPNVSDWARDTISPGSIGFCPEGVAYRLAEALGSKVTFLGHGPEKSLFADQRNLETCIQSNPEFFNVYKFIGGVFDPSIKGHLKTLKDMADFDRETVLMLMRNLAVNLSRPDFDQNKLCSPANGTNLSEPRTDVSCTVKEQMCLPCSAAEAPLKPDPLKGACNKTVSEKQEWCHPYDGGGGAGSGGRSQVLPSLSASEPQGSILQCC